MTAPINPAIPGSPTVEKDLALHMAKRALPVAPMIILAALLNHHPLPQGRGCPEPWPALLAVGDGLPTDPDGDNERNLHL